MYPAEDNPIDPLLAHKATADPDTMYLHEALKQPDQQHFINVMTKEVNKRIGNGNFIIQKKARPAKGCKSAPGRVANETQTPPHHGENKEV